MGSLAAASVFVGLRPDTQLYYVMYYGSAMARTVQARLDARAEADLAVLRNEGHNESEPIRLALREERGQRRSELRFEAEKAAADPEDRAEARPVRAGMDALAAPWPES
jgi:hypothetical protein